MPNAGASRHRDQTVQLIGMSRRRAVVNTADRLARFAERPMSLEDQELALPFADRVLNPAIRRASLRLGQLMPAKNAEKLRRS